MTRSPMLLGVKTFADVLSNLPAAIRDAIEKRIANDA